MNELLIGVNWFMLIISLPFIKADQVEDGKE